MSKRVRGYCFTVNNYTDDDIVEIFCTYHNGEGDTVYHKTDCTYIIYGFEVAPTTGTPHLQGYIHFSQPKTMKYVINLIQRASLKEAKATGDKFQQRWEYCKKSGNYVEYGDPPKQGVDNDYTKVLQSIEEGVSYKELFKLYPKYMLYHSRNVANYIENIMPYKRPTTIYIHATSMNDVNDVIAYIENSSEYKIANLDRVVINDYSELNGMPYVDVIVLKTYISKNDTPWDDDVNPYYKYGYENRLIRCKYLITWIALTKTSNMFYVPDNS